MSIAAAAGPDGSVSSHLSKQAGALGPAHDASANSGSG
jgi:hypothetical protein